LKEIKPPKLISDVYRDLRDRRLLLPAVGLLVALVAVPMMLKSSEASTPPAPAPVVSEPDNALTAAVLADDTISVRNYRKRLESLKSKNPFKPQFVPDTGSEGGDETVPGTGGTSGGGGAVAATGSASGGAYPTETGTSDDLAINDGTEDITVDETDTEVVDEGGNGGGGGGGNEPSGDDVEVVSELFTRRVDVMIGLEGNPKIRENVKPMTILPDETTPVVAFLGTDEAGKRAAFVVAKDATLAGGTAACVPAPENCLYITLEKGETAKLDFGPDGQTYDLRLLQIRDVELKPE